MTDPRRIRIGHAERDAAVERLREAAGEGRLSLDELDARIEAALGARTRGDLSAVLVDLVPPAELQALVDPEGAPQARGDAPGWAWQDPLVLTGRWDDVVRAGTWEVPPFLELHPVAASVKLNFVDAVVPRERVDIDIVPGTGSTVLVVPEGWGVDVSRVAPGMARVNSKVPARPTGHAPQVVVRGRLSLGSLSVRNPNWFDSWLRERRLANGGGLIAKN